MIQRIQSLYLLLVISLGVSLFFMPFASVNSTSDPTAFTVLHLMDVLYYETGVAKTSTTLFAPAIITTLFITIALITIFSFKNRKMQIMLCKLMMLLLTILIALIFYHADSLSSHGSASTKPIYHAGTYLPVITLILLYMSLKAIMKDDELVKSADRIR